MTVPAIKEEIAKLRCLAEKRGALAEPICAEMVVVSEWVRFKCRFGCKGYGKHMTCPPFAPTPEETRRMLREYTSGLLLRFDGFPGRERIDPDEIPEDFHPWYRDLIIWIHDTVYFLEKTAFYDGFHKAFGFVAYPCIYCEHCVAEEQEASVDESFRRLCRHLDKARPSMEAAGIDVFATAKKVGWNISTIPCKNMEYGKITHGNITSIALLLID